MMRFAVTMKLGFKQYVLSMHHTYEAAEKRCDQHRRYAYPSVASFDNTIPAFYVQEIGGDYK
jgi:hypothetical protein